MTNEEKKFRQETGALAEEFDRLCQGKDSYVTMTTLAGYLVRSWLCMQGREEESRKRLKMLIDDLWAHEREVHPDHSSSEPHGRN